MTYKIISFILFQLCIWASSMVYANQVSLINAELEPHSGLWVVRVTLEHQDKGWEHYADGWRIVTSGGTILGERTLYHPHVAEQPFTRSLSGVKIPSPIKQIYIEAHDNVHGWSKDKLQIDLTKTKGQGYTIITR